MSGLRGHRMTVIAATVISVCFTVVLLGIGGFLGTGKDYRFRALVPNSQDVFPGATVRLAGLRVGKVQTVTPRDGHAELGIGLESKYGPVRSDARVEVRMRTIAGENYVELYPGPGRGKALRDGQVLPLSQAVEAVQLDQILSVLDKPTRARAQQMIEGLGGGLTDRGAEVNDFLDSASGVVERAAPIARVLAGDRERVADLIAGLGQLTAAVGDRGAAIRRLMRQGRATADVLSARDGSIRALLDELEPTLTQVRRTTTTLRDTTGTVAPVLAGTGALLYDLKPAVRNLRPAAGEARALVSELGRAAPPLRSLLTRVRSVAKPTVSALPPLRSTLCEANPLIEYAGRYRLDLGALIGAFASGTNFYNTTGHGARIHGMVSENTPVIFDPATSKAVNKLLSGGVLSKIRQIGWNPYPKPGGVRSDKRGTGEMGPSESSIPFERLQRAC